MSRPFTTYERLGSVRCLDASHAIESQCPVLLMKHQVIMVMNINNRKSLESNSRFIQWFSRGIFALSIRKNSEWASKMESDRQRALVSGCYQLLQLDNIVVYFNKF